MCRGGSRCASEAAKLISICCAPVGLKPAAPVTNERSLALQEKRLMSKPMLRWFFSGKQSEDGRLSCPGPSLETSRFFLNDKVQERTPSDCGPDILHLTGSQPQEVVT